jgi:hypothetical protein
MKSIELLKKYPLSTEVVREWFIQKMIESVKGDTTVPEDFKNFMIEQGIPNDTLCIFIDSNPRSLFDVFDENNIRIHIVVGSDVSADNYSFHIASDVKKTDASQGASVNGLTNDFKTRKEA